MKNPFNKKAIEERSTSQIVSDTTFNAIGVLTLFGVALRIVKDVIELFPKKVVVADEKPVTKS